MYEKAATFSFNMLVWNLRLVWQWNLLASRNNSHYLEYHIILDYKSFIKCVSYFFRARGVQNPPSKEPKTKKRDEKHATMNWSVVF
jgi:hypothetical protein